MGEQASQWILLRVLNKQVELSVQSILESLISLSVDAEIPVG